LAGYPGWLAFGHMWLPIDLAENPELGFGLKAR